MGSLGDLLLAHAMAKKRCCTDWHFRHFGFTSELHMDYPAIRYPLHLQKAQPLVLSRTAIALEHPAIAKIYESTFEFVNFDPALPHPCVMALTPTSEFKHLLEPHWKSLGLEAEDVGAKCLVLNLSSGLGGAEAAFAGQRPTVFNTRDLDLIRNETYLGWSACLPGETELTTIQVQLDLKLWDVFWDLDQRKPQRWGWMPMLVIGRDTVAVGGFAVDEDWMVWAGLKQMNASHQSVDLFCDAELEAAAASAETHGDQPWLYRRWHDGSQWLVEAPLLMPRVSRKK